MRLEGQMVQFGWDDGQEVGKLLWAVLLGLVQLGEEWEQGVVGRDGWEWGGSGVVVLLGEGIVLL